jgi:chemotaxis protein methyltransferase CheR
MDCGYLHFEGISTERPPVRQIPRFRSAAGSTVPPDQHVVHGFFLDLFERAGISASAYRSSALSRRTAACLRFLRANDLEGARRKLEQQPELAAAAVNIILLGVTEFCRDPLVFKHLGEEIATTWQLLDHPPRVWSAACSDGRELLTAGILLSEAGLLAGAELLGTDCRPEAIDFARAARYPSTTLDKVEASWRNHFVHSEDGVSPHDALRRVMRWKRADVLKSAEPGPWNLILWRNMAIYLEPSAATPVWHNLFAALAPGGYLVTGKADNPPPCLPLRKVAPCIFRKGPQP